MTWVDERFRCMGCDCRVLVEDGPDPARDAARVRAYLEEFDRRLSRFRPDSELSALNADPRETVPVSPLMHAAIAAGLWAARRTNGLVDPTLLDAIEASGYDEAFAGAAPRERCQAPIRADRCQARNAWRRVRLAPGVVIRPPGMRFDTGGFGKGLAADAGAELLRGRRRFVVDCGGDMRVAGAREIHVAGPGGTVVERLHGEGGVATSGIHRRSWAGGHHLLDPATGRPAWTGVQQVTALAPTALEAEALAKAALLSGGDRRWLPHGGHVIEDERAAAA